MLRSRSLDTAVALVESLLAKGYVVEPRPETPMYGLVTSSLGLGMCSNRITNEVHQSGLREAAWDIISNTEVVNVKLGLTSSDHDCDMDRSQLSVAGIMRRNVDIVRNQAAPLVKDILQRVQTGLASLETVAIQTPIISDTLHEIYDDRYFDDMFGSEQISPRNEINLISNLPTLDLAGLKNLCLTGVSSFDKKIDSFIEVLGVERLVTAYSLVFQGSTETGYSYNTLDRDQLLAIALICRNLEEESIQKQLDVTLDKETVEVLRITTLGRIRGKIDMYKAYYEQGLLVIEWPEQIHLQPVKGQCIKVHDALYEEFLEAGGSPDALYGAFITDRTRQISELTQNKAKYMAASRHYLDGIISANTGRKDAAIKLAIADGFLAFVSEYTTVAGKDINADTILTQVRAALMDVTSGELEDTVDLVTNLVCELLFPNTYAKHIITSMQKFQTQKPEAGANDLCSMAILDLLIKYVVGCMLVKKLS